MVNKKKLVMIHRHTTSFPSYLSSAQIMGALLEAEEYIDNNKVPIIENNKNTYRVTGYTTGGLPIVFIKNRDEEIISIFPEVRIKKKTLLYNVFSSLFYYLKKIVYMLFILTFVFRFFTSLIGH